MKKKLFTAEHIVGVLKQAQVGVPVAEVIRKAARSADPSARTWRKHRLFGLLSVTVLLTGCTARV